MITRRIQGFAGCVIVVIALFSYLTPPASAITPEELSETLISETAVLIDGDTGQVLFGKDMYRWMYPASTTKVMTALLALENNSLDDVITMSSEAVFSLGPGASHIALDVDEQLTLEQAMYALSIQSANDAANGIAELVGGSLQGFVDMMNERAKQAGALGTHFANAHGMPDPNHYTTAFDLAHIMMEAIKIPRFCEFFSKDYYELTPTNKQEESRYFWRSKQLLLGPDKYEGCFAEKTGWTEASGYTYVTAVRRNGITLIAVVMKSPLPGDKLIDATALLDYGFGDFRTAHFSPWELSLDDYTFIDAQGNTAEAAITPDTGFDCLIPKAYSKEDVTIEYKKVPGFPGEDGSFGVNAVFSLPALGGSPMPATLGEVSLVAYPVVIASDTEPPDAAPTPEGEAENQDVDASTPGNSTWLGVVVQVFVWVVLSAVALFAILLIRRVLIIKLRRRKSRRVSGRDVSYISEDS